MLLVLLLALRTQKQGWVYKMFWSLHLRFPIDSLDRCLIKWAYSFLSLAMKQMLGSKIVLDDLDHVVQCSHTDIDTFNNSLSYP